MCNTRYFGIFSTVPVLLLETSDFLVNFTTSILVIKIPLGFNSDFSEKQEEIRKRSATLIEKAMTLLQLTAIAQFGCGSQERAAASAQFYKNTLKKTSKGNHFGDLRAKLEIAVDRVLEACR